MKFEAQIMKICKIDRKSWIKQTSVLFFKYLISLQVRAFTTHAHAFVHRSS